MARLCGSPVTVAQACEEYIASRSGVTDKTLSDYRMFLRKHVAPTLGAIPLQTLTKTDVAKWVTAMETAGAKGKTIKNRVLFLAGACKFAIDKGYIRRSPAQGIRLPETARREIEWLTPAEFGMLLAVIPERHKLMMTLVASTGLRWGEVTALNAQAIDLNRKTVRVFRAYKYSPQRGLYIGPPKTKASRRILPLSDELIEPLRRQMARNRDLVFVNTNGDPIRHTRFREDVWNPAVNVANGLPAFKDRTPQPGGPWDLPPVPLPLGKRPHIHDLRHSHASWLIHAGLDLMVVQRRLGHESIKTTMDIYGHLAEEHSRAAATAVSGMLGDVFTQL